MIHSAAEVIQQYLIDEELGVVWNASRPSTTDYFVYRDTIPPTTPDLVIVVNDIMPSLDGRDMRTGDSIQHPGIMIRVRALNPDSGKVKGNDIQIALDMIKKTIVTIPSDDKQYLVAAFCLTSGLMYMGQEENKNRHLFSLNGTITIKEL